MSETKRTMTVMTFALLAASAVFLAGCVHSPLSNEWHHHEEHVHHGPDIHGYGHEGVTDYGHSTGSTHTHGTPMVSRCCDDPRPCDRCHTCHSCGRRLDTTSSEANNGYGHSH